MRRSPAKSGLVVVAQLLTMSGCKPEDTPSPSSIEFDGPARPLDEIDCGSLLADEEIEQSLGGPVTSHGKSASSCYWFAGNDLVQVVIQSSRDTTTWKTLILEEYTEEIEGVGVEMWADPGSESVGVFGPERGLLIHGVRDRQAAIDPLLLAISRL